MSTYIIAALLVSIILVLLVCIRQSKILKVKTKEINSLKEQSLSTEANSLLKRILTISFEKGTLVTTSEKIIKVFIDHYNVSYCSLLLYSQRKEMKLVATNLSSSELATNFESYLNEVFIDMKKNGEVAKIQCSDGYLTYPTAFNRGIKYFYFIPLKIGTQVLGALVLEDKKRETLEKYDGDLFSIVLENTSLVLQNLIYNDKLIAFANIDGLTQIYNRRYMETFLQEQIQRYKNANKTFSLVVFDIDYFKKFNDNYGHLVGDETLKIVSRFVKESLRKGEDNVFRYGGEEFVIFLSNTNSTQAYNVIDCIREGLSEQRVPIDADGNYTKVTASFGIAEFSKNGESIKELIETADKALYYSKEHGRNCVTDFNSILEKIVECS